MVEFFRLGFDILLLVLFVMLLSGGEFVIVCGWLKENEESIQGEEV